MAKDNIELIIYVSITNKNKLLRHLADKLSLTNDDEKKKSSHLNLIIDSCGSKNRKSNTSEIN